MQRTKVNKLHQKRILYNLLSTKVHFYKRKFRLDIIFFNIIFRVYTGLCIDHKYQYFLDLYLYKYSGTKENKKNRAWHFALIFLFILFQRLKCMTEI